MKRLENSIAVVGAGRMGANITRRMKEVGYRTGAIYDVRGEMAHELARELAAHAARALTELTERADVVITVVTDDAAMRAIYAESGESLLRGASGKLFINCATVSPDIHVEVERLVEAAG